MFDQVGRLAVNHPWKVCAGWLLLGGVLTVAAPAWDSHSRDDDIRFLPERCASVKGHDLLAQAFPDDIYASRAVFAIERFDRPLTDGDFALVERMTAELERLRTFEPELRLGQVRSFQDPLIGKRLTSADGCCTLLQVSLDTPYLALQTEAAVDRADSRLREVLADAGPDVPTLYVTGSAGIGRDLVRGTRDSLDRTSCATIALVIIILVLLYRAPLLALVPLATIGLSAWVALKLLALATQLPGVHLATVSQVFVIVLLFGAGTDYCIFLISRYREELRAGRDYPVAVRNSVGAVGAALVASAGTVICGLSLMVFADFVKVRCAGPAIGLSLGVALLASLTLTPALLQLLGKRLFWPLEPPREPLKVAPLPFKRQSPEKKPWPWEAVWEAVSRRVVDRPRPVLAWTLLALTPLTAFGLLIAPAYRPTGQLASSADSIQGCEAIQRHFTAGETGPLTVLLVSQTDWNTAAGREVIDHLSRGFSRLENVAEVRSLIQPLGERLNFGKDRGGELPGSPGLLGSLVRQQCERAALAHYTADIPQDGGTRHVTRLDVITASDPFEPASIATLELIETWLTKQLPHSGLPLTVVQAECHGLAVHTRDLAQVVESDRACINGLVLAGIALILLALFRRPGLIAYLVGTVLVSYWATVGATALVGSLWAGQLVTQLDWRILFFLFTLLMAVGQDYNILLLSRIEEEQTRHGPIEGIRRGLAHTGGAISACGLIMAGTFATLMLTSLGTLVQTGFALTFGVLLDTFVVRPILVPAFLRLMTRDGASLADRLGRNVLANALRARPKEQQVA